MQSEVTIPPCCDTGCSPVSGERRATPGSLCLTTSLTRLAFPPWDGCRGRLGRTISCWGLDWGQSSCGEGVWGCKAVLILLSLPHYLGCQESNYRGGGEDCQLELWCFRRHPWITTESFASTSREGQLSHGELLLLI